jgi:hypothetical protein
LVAALSLPEGEAGTFEIGGADRVSYAGIMREYARQRGLRRLMIPVPVLTPYLSSLWLGLVTPVFARIGRALIEGVQNPTGVEDHSARAVFPIRPMGVAAAVTRAMALEDRESAETRWCDAVSSAGGPPASVHRLGSRLVDTRSLRVPCPPAEAFGPIRRIGGARGWYYGDILWRLRGLLDLMLGGVGMRRGRRDPETLAPGESLDFWRVEAFQPDRHLLLQAEMRLPGRAWLEFRVDPAPGGSTIHQSAVFHPRGLVGLLYWHALFPVHRVVFAGMLRRIGDMARDGMRGTVPSTGSPGEAIPSGTGSAARP